MTLPVSSYEELLARVRSLTSETIQLRQEISSSLCGEPDLSSENDYEPLIKSHAHRIQERISANQDLRYLKLFDRTRAKNTKNKMFDEKELEELYDDFLGMDGDMFLESEMDVRKLDNDIVARDIAISATKIPSNLKNNNFLDGTAGARVDKPDVSIQLDLLNQNFISSDIREFERNPESRTGTSDSRAAGGTLVRPTLFLDKKVDEIDNELKEVDEKLVSPSPSVEKNSFPRVGWTPDSLGLWHSGPSSLNLSQPFHKNALYQDLSSSVTCPSHGTPPFSSFSSSTKRTYSHQQLGAKVEMVYSLLSMLDTDNREDMSKTFLAMSSSPESCLAMRQSGCLPLLIQLIHSSELDIEVRNRAAEALHNVVYAQSDEKRRKREVRVLKLLQQVREYCNELRNDSTQTQLQESDRHPINATGTLMKLSFDAEHRQAICALGGLHAITDLIQVDHKFHGSTSNDTLCITLRRYAGMSLTNLTFGDGKNKALLCSFSKFLLALTDQLKSSSEDLRQVTASVLRNLSWRADSDSKQALRNVGAVSALTISAMEAKKESTLKSILSALWNLSAHCSLNKVDICSVPGALAFLVKMLKYKSASNTLSIIENAGGILRNVSSHIAVREDYRQVLRDNYCFEVLLEHLRSPSLTIVSNACGTLWNLSARCPEDQRRLWEMGATSMLRSLVQSKHKMISMGSSAALKNLLAANPNENLLNHLDSTAKSLGLQNLPTLFVRKKRALEQELNITLAETCENIEPAASSSHINKPAEEGMKEENTEGPKRSESHDSVKSTQSDTVYELINQMTHVSEDKALENSNATLHNSLDGKLMNRRTEDQRVMKRYTVSMIPTPTSKKINQDRINEKTREEKPVADDSNGILTDADKDQARTDSKQRNRKGIPVRKTKPKRTVIEDDVSHEHSSSSKLPEEYSLEHGETESLERVNITSFVGNRGDTVDSLFNSHKAITGPELNCRKNAGDESDSVDETKESHSMCGNDVEYKEEQEGVMLSREQVPSRDLVTRSRNGVELSDRISNVKIASVYGKTNSKEHDDDFNENSNRIKIPEQGSGENELSTQDHSKNHSLQIIYCIPQDSNSGTNGLFSDDNEPSSIECNGENSKKGYLLEADLGSNDDVLQVFKKNVSDESSPDGKSKFSEPNQRKVLKENSKEFDERGENQSGFLCRKTDLDGDKLELNKNSHRESKRFDQKSGCWTNGNLESVREESRSCSRTFDDCNSELKKCHDSAPFVTSDAEVTGSSAAGILINEKDKIQASFDSDGTKGSLYSPVLPFKGDTLEKLTNVNGVEVGLKTSSACAFPRFKVGSPITDTKALQMEARKVCGEIQKHHDFEMGCSLTSEISVVSCSSFLDSGDYSLFDSSTDAVNFDDSEMVKPASTIKTHSSPKPVSQAAEPLSLPSLGSLKNEQIEALDLDNSVLSVASITSEIDENYTKDQVCFSSYAKTYKADGHSEFPEETSGDATLVSKGDDDTLNTDLLDDDSSLHSQENLPLDTDTIQGDGSDRMRTKLTPKEKRKNFNERYRTYTIRDFKASNGTGMVALITGNQDKNDVELTKEVEVPESCTRRGMMRSHVNSICSQYDVARDIECNKENVYEKALGHDSSFKTSYCGRGHEPLQYSKSFDKERDCISEYVLDSRSLNDLLSIGPTERKELVDNAKLVAFSLKTAVQDWETDLVSDSETEEPQKSSDIDTATYTKAFRNRHQSRPSFQELQSLQSLRGPCTENSEKIGAKIYRPRVKAEDETIEELSRGIRGRRKPLYSSPQKNPLKIKGLSSSPLNEKATSVIVDIKKQTCQSPTLHREGTFTKEDGLILKKSEGKNSGTLQNRSFEFKNSTRKNGNNKCMASGGNCKAVGESRVERIRRPLSTYASKANDKRMEIDSSQRRPFSTGVGSRTVGEVTVTAKKPASTCSVSQKMRNSSSSQNMKTGNSPVNGCPIKPRNLESQSGKSQSDASLNLADSKDKVCAGKLKASKKEVVSRIAGLWRKVEETKKNKNIKDSRVWIGPEKNTTSNEASIMEKEEILDIPTRKIVHSFTCQALTDETCNDFASHQRNSRNPEDVSYDGSTEERQDKIQKRGIISAVVTPYNYNPPVSMVTHANFPEIENFQKTSLKVTTV